MRALVEHSGALKPNASVSVTSAWAATAAANRRIFIDIPCVEFLTSRKSFRCRLCEQGFAPSEQGLAPSVIAPKDIHCIIHYSASWRLSST